MNPKLQQLHPYPFQKLQALKRQVAVQTSQPHIALSVGEPKHSPPAFALKILAEKGAEFSHYSATAGTEALREAIADWLRSRFNLSQDFSGNKHVLPVCGTREGLFSFAQACLSPGDVVICPNPFYQIYEGAALLAGATPWFVPGCKEVPGMPDYSSVPEDVWQRCQLLFLCSPGNPSGAVHNLETLKHLIELADRYDFIIAADECYSEIYLQEDQPPPGLLQACQQLGRDDFTRCVVFHSLSKRSNMPGLRSGFAAGDADILASYLNYRTYHGSSMPLPHQHASIALWQDEEHVRHNRSLYRKKFELVRECLTDVWDVQLPEAGFYLWQKTPLDDETFAQRLFAEENITVLPGRYLGREVNGENPGAHYVRMALVADMDSMHEAASRLRRFIQGLS